MRTKNLNLKKKIAFIASVAMIASTAAYLPAEVTQNILNSGITVNAALAAGTFDSTNNATTVAAATTINTFNVLVRVDGKYLAVNKTDANDYKTFASESSARAAGYELIDAAANLDLAATKSDGMTALTDPFADSGTAVAVSKNYDVMRAVDLTIPYIESANSTITLEFSAKTGSKMSSRSITEIDVELNEHGVGFIPEQTEYVVCQSNDSDYKEATGAGGTSTGDDSYEILDLSQLLVKVTGNATKNVPESFTTATITNIKSGTTNTPQAVDMAVAADPAKGTVVVDGALLEEKKVTPEMFNVKAVGNVNARVLSEQLTSRAKPGDSITITLGNYGTWTPSGVGVNATAKTLTLTMDENGYAESGLITMTKDSEKEYYVYVVKNKDNASEAVGEVETDLTIGSTVNGTAGADTAIKNLAGNFKFEKKVTTASFKDSFLDETTASEHYVTKYTIYNNEIEDEYANNDVFTIKIGSAATDIVRLAAAGAKTSTDTTETDGDTTVTVGAATQKSGADYRILAKGNDASAKIEVKKSAAGTATSKILAYTEGTDTTYVQFIFTNTYKIKYTDSNDLTNPGQSADGYVTVSNGVEITPPTTPVKAGYTFDGWNSSVGPTQIFNTESSSQILTGTEAQAKVNPNVTLSARWKGQYYNVELDAGDGIIEAPGVARTSYVPSSYKTYNNTTGGYQIGTFTNIQRVAATDSDITGTGNTAGGYDGTSATSVKAARTGYVFKGWNTNKNATTGMTKKELAAAFPGENSTLKLYAIYKANENVGVTFKTFAYDAEGVVKTTDGKKAVAKDAYDNATVAKFAKNSEGVKTVTVGQALGTLPTPVKKGYEFDGWYIKKEDSTGANISAVKVDANTKFDEAVYDTTSGKFTAPTSVGVAASITLYAKFTQKTYNITFDLDGGAWSKIEWDKETSAKPVSYKYVNDEIKFITAQGVTKTATQTQTAINGVTAAKGSDDYEKFRGWSINGGSELISHATLVSAIDNLDAAEDLTIKAIYKNQNVQTANISVQANGGVLYKATFDTKYELESIRENANTGVADDFSDDLVIGNIDTDGLTNIDLKGGQPEAAVSTLWSIKDNYIYSVSKAKSQGYVVARPGYTFTGWYSDAACTTPYTFGTYPTKGNEDIVYAGWKAASATRYRLKYDLYDEDKAVIDDDDFGSNTNAAPMRYAKTFTGTTGEVVNAKDLSITVRRGTGVNAETTKFVYDSKLSEGLKTSDKLEAKFVLGQLQQGNFVEDSNNYVEIYGRYIVEGSQTPDEPEPVVSTELGNATNVKGTANGDKVTISFKAADNATQYQVCKIVNGKKYYTAKTDKLSIDITPASVDYEVYVIAFDKDGKSTHSETIKLNAVKKYDLGTVMDPVATEKMEEDGTKTVTISWSKAENATWYKVFKIVNGKKYWGKKVTDTSYVLKNIPATDSYIVYVAAGDDKGHVTYGARKKVSKFPSVTNVTLAPDKKTVTFDAAEGAVKYQVAKIEADNKVNYSAKSTTTSITLKNAFKAGQKYYVLAFFTDEDGKTKSSYSDTFEVK